MISSMDIWPYPVKMLIARPPTCIFVMFACLLFQPDFSALSSSDLQSSFVSCPSAENLLGSGDVASCYSLIPVEVM